MLKLNNNKKPIEQDLPNSNTTLVKVKYKICGSSCTARTIQIQHLLKLNYLHVLNEANYKANSNTTLVKVKFHIFVRLRDGKINSNTTLVKVKLEWLQHGGIDLHDLIQIQHLLKLNLLVALYFKSQFQPIQIQHLLKLNGSNYKTKTTVIKFKYNTC